MQEWRNRPGKRDRGRAYGRARNRAAQRLIERYPGVFERYLRDELVRTEDELRLKATDV